MARADAVFSLVDPVIPYPGVAPPVGTSVHLAPATVYPGMLGTDTEEKKKSVRPPGHGRQHQGLQYGHVDDNGEDEVGFRSDASK